MHPRSADLEPRILTPKANLKSFDCGDSDLNDFLLNDALYYQEQYLAHTILLYYKDILVGYYTLACDAIRLDVREKSFFSKRKQIHSYPAIKIARIAFIKQYQSQGFGSFILDIVKGFVHSINKTEAGCRFITVDAYPEKVDFYLKRGFKYNIHKDYKKKNHPSLRLDVWSHFNERDATKAPSGNSSLI